MTADIVERLRAVRGASDRHRRWELQDMARDALAALTAARAEIEALRAKVEALEGERAALTDNERALLGSMVGLDDAGFRAAMESASTRFELLRTIRKSLTGRRA